MLARYLVRTERQGHAAHLLSTALAASSSLVFAQCHQMFALCHYADSDQPYYFRELVAIVFFDVERFVYLLESREYGD